MPTEKMMNAASAQNGLSPRMRAVARLEIQGMKAKDIADHLGIHPMTISQVRATSAYQELVRQLHSEVDDAAVKQAIEDPVRRFLGENALAAAKQIVDLMHNAEEEKIRQTSAFDILDRTGYAKSQKVEGKLEVTLRDEDLVAVIEATQEVLGLSEAAKLDLGALEEATVDDAPEDQQVGALAEGELIPAGIAG